MTKMPMSVIFLRLSADPQHGLYIQNRTGGTHKLPDRHAHHRLVPEAQLSYQATWYVAKGVPPNGRTIVLTYWRTASRLAKHHNDLLRQSAIRLPSGGNYCRIAVS